METHTSIQNTRIKSLYTRALVMGNPRILRHRMKQRACGPVTIVALRLAPESQIPKRGSIYSLVKSRERIASKSSGDMRSRMFNLPHLLLSGVLESLTAGRYGRMGGWRTQSLHECRSRLRCGDRGEVCRGILIENLVIFFL